MSESTPLLWPWSNAISLPADAFTFIDGTAVTTSRAIAAFFGKRHSNVLRDIENLLTKCPPEFELLNFFRSSYIDTQGKARPMYQIAKTGVDLLTMSFTGSVATRFKIIFLRDAYRAAFTAFAATRRQTRSIRRALRSAA